jgi:hypothetical protein
LRNNASKPQLLQVERIDERFNNANRVIFGHKIVETFRQQTRLGAYFALNKPLLERTRCGNV